MNCRNCGAAMNPVGGRGYFRCQHCNSFEFPAAAEDGIVTLDHITKLNCPVCHDALSSAALEGHTVSFCGRCRGLLTTNALFSQIVAQRRAKNVGSEGVTQPLERNALQRRRKCPQCSRIMDTHPYGGGGAVVVDTCSQCHLIWLDAGEIDDIARHRPHGIPAFADPILLTSTAGASRELESHWHWGDSEFGVSDYEGGVDGIWGIIKRLL